MRTEDVRVALRKKYADPEWVFVEEVAPRTGGGTRYADAVAVNLWSSRGHAIHGFEIKVSRSDWLHELKKPQKAEESVFEFCDYWWVVTPAGIGIVKDGELPPTWGHLEIRSNGVFVMKKAPQLTPKPVTRGFFAALIRRANDNVEKRAHQMQADAVNKAHAKIEEEIKYRVERSTHKHREIVEQMGRIKDKTGIDFLNHYAVPSVASLKLAQQLELLQGYSSDAMLGRISELAEALDRHANTLRKAVIEFTGEEVKE